MNKALCLIYNKSYIVVMGSSFGPEGPGSIPDNAKDPPSKCGALDLKIRGSESPVVGR